MNFSSEHLLHSYIIIYNTWHRGRRWKFKFTLAARPLLIILLVSSLLMVLGIVLCLFSCYSIWNFFALFMKSVKRTVFFMTHCAQDIFISSE
jgi:hypothetical protein